MAVCCCALAEENAPKESRTPRQSLNRILDITFTSLTYGTVNVNRPDFVNIFFCSEFVTIGHLRSEIPTAADYRESGDLLSGGTLCLMSAAMGRESPVV
jgi:hypothetical protein